MKHRILTMFLGVICLSFPPISAAIAQNPEFAFPVDCTLGTDCWIANYVDVDPAPDSHKDFRCNARTYEEHKGTDFALRSRAEMRGGVNVLAAADGTVLRFRDGEDDTPKSVDERAAITAANKDCGNGVILDHGNGLLTYYCHLKEGSINLKTDQTVSAGDILGQIGQSGNAEFPHLHLTIVWEGGHIDPFTGHLKEEGCGRFKNNLWADDLNYSPYALYDGGFSGAVPDFKAIENGQEKTRTLSPGAEAFVFWASFYQIGKDDEVTLTIKDPDGEIFAQRTVIQGKNRARQHYYTGRTLKDRTLKTGTYTGIADIKSDGYPRERKEFTIEVK